MRPATLVAGSVVCATLGAADLGVLSIVVVPKWLGPDVTESSRAPKASKVAAAQPGPAAITPSEPVKPEVQPPTPPQPEVVKPEAVAAELPKPEPLAAKLPKPEPPPDPEPPAQAQVDEPEELVVDATERKTPAKPGTVIVRFDLEKTDVGPEVRGQLQGLLAGARPSDQFRVEGHADSSGREDGNRYFSRERAKAVARELIRMGVSPARISTKSFGSTRPLVAGRTAAAYERNRRVELYLERSGR